MEAVVAVSGRGEKVEGKDGGRCLGMNFKSVERVGSWSLHMQYAT